MMFLLAAASRVVAARVPVKLPVVRNRSDLLARTFAARLAVPLIIAAGTGGFIWRAVGAAVGL